MSINLAGIANATNAATALAGLVLVSPQSTVGYQPQNAPSWTNDKSALPSALVFNYEGEQTSALTSDITDHFIEDNTAVQDQIALKPVTITTAGFVGELNDIAPAALLPLKVIADKLVAIGAYAPQVSTTALIAYNEATLAYQVGRTLVNSAVNAWSTISNIGNSSSGTTTQGVINGSTTQDQLKGQKNSSQTKQQIYYQQFYGYWVNRTLFTVQTPWAVFQDMAIMSLRSVQGEETNSVSTFELTFKQMRFASTLEVAGSSNSANFQGRLQSQGASLVDLGTNTLTSSPLTFAAAF